MTRPLGDPAQEEAGLNTVGLELKEMTASVVSDLVDSLGKMEVPDPNTMIPTITAITSTIGSLLQSQTGGGGSQVWPLIHFFLFPFCKKIIDLPGGQFNNPLSG